jgi:hypothetical protein
MTSFYPTDPIRSRLEWNATLNPAAAPQTTEATKFLRKVITAHYCQHDLISFPDVHHCNDWWAAKASYLI